MASSTALRQNCGSLVSTGEFVTGPHSARGAVRRLTDGGNGERHALQLPAGYERRLSRTSGREFFVAADGSTSWDAPTHSRTLPPPVASAPRRRTAQQDTLLRFAAQHKFAAHRKDEAAVRAMLVIRRRVSMLGPPAQRGVKGIFESRSTPTLGTPSHLPAATPAKAAQPLRRRRRNVRGVVSSARLEKMKQRAELHGRLVQGQNQQITLAERRISRGLRDISLITGIAGTETEFIYTPGGSPYSKGY